MASRARASRTQERGAGRQGCPLCSRTAHSGFNCSGPRRMERRVPVALLGATGVTGMDGSENPHAVGDGGSRAAARYSSAASLQERNASP